MGNLAGQNRSEGERNVYSVLCLAVSIYFCLCFYLMVRVAYYAAIRGEMGGGHVIGVDVP